MRQPLREWIPTAAGMVMRNTEQPCLRLMLCGRYRRHDRGAASCAGSHRAEPARAQSKGRSAVCKAGLSALPLAAPNNPGGDPPMSPFSYAPDVLPPVAVSLIAASPEIAPARMPTRLSPVTTIVPLRVSDLSLETMQPDQAAVRGLHDNPSLLSEQMANGEKRTPERRNETPRPPVSPGERGAGSSSLQDQAISRSGRSRNRACGSIADARTVRRSGGTRSSGRGT